MNYRKYCKVVVALVLCFALALMPFSFSVSATSSFSSGSSNRFGALIAAALTAFNITIESLTAPISDMFQYIADPFELVYTYREQELTDFFDQSVVKITPDKTIIDGVEYSDVWFSFDAANKLRVNAGDFSTAYSISSNSNGTFASGSGLISGIPVYQFTSSPLTFRTQSFSTSGEGTYVQGSVTLENYYSGTSQRWQVYNGTTLRNSGSGWIDSFSIRSTSVSGGSPTAFSIFLTKGTSTSSYTWPFDYQGIPFDFDYVSGDLPLDPLPSDNGLRLRVPSSALDTFIDDYPEFTDPSGHAIDVNLDPDIGLKLDSLCDLLAAVIPIIMYQQDMITYEAMDTPAPPAYTNIADTNYSILNNTLQNIEDWLNDIYTGIQAIPSAIGGLIDGFLSDIEIGPIKVFDKALDLIQSLFAPVFLLIRNGLSIWSYVVTWFNSLASPLAFMVSILPAAVWLPVYAVVAGTICLAIYRRFGK